MGTVYLEVVGLTPRSARWRRRRTLPPRMLACTVRSLGRWTSTSWRRRSLMRTRSRPPVTPRRMHAKEAPPAAASHSDKPGQSVSIQALQGNHGGVLDRGKILNANLHYEWTRYDTSNESDHPTPFEYRFCTKGKMAEGNLLISNTRAKSTQFSSFRKKTVCILLHFLPTV